MKRLKDVSVHAEADKLFSFEEVLELMSVDDVACCGYCSYGIVLKKLDLTDRETVDVFVEAVNAEPLLWSAWLELSLLISDREMVRVSSVVFWLTVKIINDNNNYLLFSLITHDYRLHAGGP